MNGGGGSHTGVVTNADGISAFVAVGDVLAYRDRYADAQNNVVLPGAARLVFGRFRGNDINIDILNNTTLVISGPGRY